MVIGFPLTELRGDLFSHHATPLEGYIFVAVDERGEDAMYGEISRRNNGKQEGVAAKVGCSPTSF